MVTQNMGAYRLGAADKAVLRYGRSASAPRTVVPGASPNHHAPNYVCEPGAIRAGRPIVAADAHRGQFFRR